MAGNKTIPSSQDVDQFLNALSDERKRRDAFALLELVKEATGLEPQLWGSSIVGFGSYHYKYASGREGDSILAGFSPRAQNFAIYNMGSLDPQHELFQRLGKYELGKGCLYIKRLDDVDLPALRSLIAEAFRLAQQNHAG